KNRTQSIPCMPLPGLILYFTKIDKNFRPYKHAVQVNKKTGHKEGVTRRQQRVPRHRQCA
ncbi:hypothetical protein RFX65_04410, partial [Acinetobacter baumannii]|nr:hypothetical protein [Acinetobacter baumannii]